MAIKKIPAREFVARELRGAGDYFNRRSLPHLMDGLKTGQRKVISAALDMSAADKIKVSSLGARAVETKAYHHGDASLQDTIVRLAQQFPGSNNVSLLEPLGSFGTAKNKQGSAPRYISTRLSKAFWQYFDKRDQKIVTPLYDDGEEIEPAFFIPMLPMILINGASGPGTGYSSNILQYQPKELKRAILELCKDGAIGKPLTPWLNGWKGKVVKDQTTGQVAFYGVVEVQTKTKLVVTEIPHSMDLIKYKTHLNKLIEKEIIKDYTNASGTGEWRIEIQVARDFTEKNSPEKILDILGLIHRTTETIVCWGVDSTKPRVFNTAEELLVEWFTERIKLSGVALNNLIEEEEDALIWLRIKRAFLAWWADNNDEVVKLSKKEIQEKIVQEIVLLNEHPKYLTRLMDIKVFNLASDEIEMLNHQIIAKENDVAKLRGFSPASWYQTNLEGVGLA